MGHKRYLLKWCLCLLLGVLSIAYLGKGFYYSVSGNDGADLWRRWSEQFYVFKGQNPFDLMQGESSKTKRNAIPDPKVGSLYEVGYPPWSYFSGYFFFWPDWPAARWWYAFLHLISLLFILWGSLQIVFFKNKLDRVIFVLSITSISAFCTTVGTGNYGTIVLALLVGSYLLEQKSNSQWSGLLMGISLLKPTLSGSFAILPLVRRKYAAIITLLLYLILSSSFIWWVTKTDPIEMIGQMFSAGRKYVAAGYSPLNVVLWIGLPYKIAFPMTALSFSFLSLIALVLVRKSDLLIQFAIASVTARLWTYHLAHSNLILLFLLLALWRISQEAKEKSFNKLMLVSVAFTLYIPSSMANFLFIQIFQNFVWFIGLIYVYSYGRKQTLEKV